MLLCFINIFVYLYSCDYLYYNFICLSLKNIYLVPGKEKNLMTFLMWVNGFVDTDMFNEVLLYSHSIWSVRAEFFCLNLDRFLFLDLCSSLCHWIPS